MNEYRIEFLAAALLATLASPLAVRAESPASVPGTAAASTQRADEGPETEAGFELHSGFWMNLHHFLYQQARLRGQADKSLPPPRGGSPSTPAPLDGLSESERRAWSATLDLRNLAHRYDPVSRRRPLTERDPAARHEALGKQLPSAACQRPERSTA